MKCDICGRGELSDKELSAHMKYYHHKDTVTKEPRCASTDICPECSHTVYYQSGCQQCYNCGWSKCQ